MQCHSSCSGILFDNNYHLNEILVKKQGLSYNTPDEEGHYNHKDRAPKVNDVCCHCGEMGTNDFLWGLSKLQAACLVEGFI